MRLTLLIKGRRRTGWVDTSSFCDALGFGNDLFRWSPSFVYVLLPICHEHTQNAKRTFHLGYMYSRNRALITKQVKKVCKTYCGPILTLLYSFLSNTSHVVLRDMPGFFSKNIWITSHAIPITQRPGWNTEHSNPHLDITMTSLLPCSNKKRFKTRMHGFGGNSISP